MVARSMTCDQVMMKQQEDLILSPLYKILKTVTFYRSEVKVDLHTKMQAGDKLCKCAISHFCIAHLNY